MLAGAAAFGMLARPRRLDRATVERNKIEDMIADFLDSLEQNWRAEKTIQSNARSLLLKVTPKGRELERELPGFVVIADFLFAESVSRLSLGCEPLLRGKMTG